MALSTIFIDINKRITDIYNSFIELLISINTFDDAVFIDIYNSFIDINNSFRDINKSFVDITKSFIDINTLIIDINKCGVGVHLY